MTPELRAGQTWTPAKGKATRTITRVDGYHLEWHGRGRDTTRYGQDTDFRAWIERTGATVTEDAT